jgi:HD-GYP domain-containing protein (c-di-GMP phosphodiesterase class II)
LPTLQIKGGEGAGALFELGDAPLVVGRDDRAEIQLFDQGVSRRHAEFYRIGDMYFIRDLESRNGTFVNEEKIGEELLRSGDEVRIAATVLIYEDQAHSTAGQPKRRSRIRTSPEAEATTTIQIDEQLTRDIDDLAEPERHERSHDLACLYECSRVIGEKKDPLELCEAIIKIVGEAVRADHACVFLRKEGSRDFELEASYEPKDSPLRRAPVISTRVIVEVVQSKRAVLTSDTKQGPSPDPKASMIGLGRPATVIGAPLVALDQVHGVLYCASHDPLRFNHENLELITAVGIQTGIALQSLLLAQRQERILIAAVRTLGSLLEMRDPVYTGHSARVAFYSAQIARRLKLSRAEIRRIQLASLLHNVSKVAMPAELMDDETDPEVINRWNAIAEKLVGRMEGLEFVLPVIQAYHERPDGKGLPKGLKGDEIPVAAKILSAADRVDTLMVRGDESGKLHDLASALEAVRDEAPDRFDPVVVDALLAAHRGGQLELPRGTSQRRRRASSADERDSADDNDDTQGLS